MIGLLGDKTRSIWGMCPLNISCLTMIHQKENKQKILSSSNLQSKIYFVLGDNDHRGCFLSVFHAGSLLISLGLVVRCQPTVQGLIYTTTRAFWFSHRMLDWIQLHSHLPCGMLDRPCCPSMPQFAVVWNVGHCHWHYVSNSVAKKCTSIYLSIWQSLLQLSLICTV